MEFLTLGCIVTRLELGVWTAAAVALVPTELASGLDSGEGSNKPLK